MADGKWIPELTATAPPTEAARRALRVRFGVVEEYLPRTVESPSDPENVHQLRVGTRRAGAALHLFGSYLPKTLAKKAKRRLRHLRHAAGEARDWDVFALALVARRQEATPREQSGLDYLLGYAAGQRAAAQADLVRANDRDGRHLEAFVARTLDALRPPEGSEDTLLPLARTLLAPLLHQLEDKTHGDLNDYAHLHQVRIAGKHLRYAMELFAGCFAPSFQEDLYPQIEEMQEILGRANDSHVATVRLEALRDEGRATLGVGWKALQPGVTALLQFHRRRLPRERRAFLKWWEGWQQSGAPALTALLAAERQ